MTTPLLLPVDAIDATAFPRDRSHLDPAALEELQSSLMTAGLRVPIEVCERGSSEAATR